jgi:hypothetical protein
MTTYREARITSVKSTGNQGITGDGEQPKNSKNSEKTKNQIF